MDYSLCYQILELPAESDWQTAQRQYRRLTARHHPDRPDHDAERSLSDINQAWSQLRRYYQAHGQLPLEADAGTSAGPATPFERPTAVRGRKRRLLALATAATALWALARLTAEPPLPVSEVTPSVASNPAQPAPHRWPDEQTTPSLAPGDPLGRVAEVLGPPHDSVGARWYYGDSWIQFRDGRISDWHSSADHPIPVDILGQPGRDDIQ